MKGSIVILPLLVLLTTALPQRGTRAGGRPTRVNGGNAAPVSKAPAAVAEPVSVAPVANNAAPAASKAATKAPAAGTGAAPATTKAPAAGSGNGAATPASSSKAKAEPAAEPASGSTGGGGGGGSKVGLAMNGESGADMSSFGGGIGWYYSWNIDPLPGTEGLEFVPMIWGSGSVDAFDGKMPGGAKYILSFNEPDIGGDGGGSLMDAASAATLHKKWADKVPSGVSIGAPAVARGGQKWLQSWLTACGGGCKYDFIPFHYYGKSATELIAYAKAFHSEFNKPLWITEWACREFDTGYICNEEEVKTFMKTSIEWFRGGGSSIVVRWSYFGAIAGMAPGDANGFLGSGGAATEVGKLYAGL